MHIKRQCVTCNLLSFCSNYNGTWDSSRAQHIWHLNSWSHRKTCVRYINLLKRAMGVISLRRGALNLFAHLLLLYVLVNVPIILSSYCVGEYQSRGWVVSLMCIHICGMFVVIFLFWEQEHKVNNTPFYQSELDCKTTFALCAITDVNLSFQLPLKQWWDCK